VTTQRILLLSVSAGAGHGRAAEALRAEAAASFPGVEAKHIDVMALVPSSCRALYADYYIKIVEHHPAVCAYGVSRMAYMDNASDKMPRDAWFAKVRRAVERLNSRQLSDTLTDLHEHWWGPLPADYWLSSAIGGLLLVCSNRVKS